VIDKTPPRAKNRCGYRRIAAEEGTRVMPGRDPSIVLIVVWFGPLPFWMPAFLVSCRRNPDVEWLIFTDAASPPRLPPNVRIVPMDADALNRRCAATLGFETHISASLPYKVCDLRPTFGLVFAQEIGTRDFWGHCDLDVVWGDIRVFMRPEILEGHDIVTSRVGRISGHFCLYRNRPEWKTLFREIPGVTRLAQDAEHRNIDEMQMTELLRSHQASRGARSLRRWATRRALPRVYWHATLTTSGANQRLLLADPALRYWWRDGKTFDAGGTEMMYLHFHQLHRTMTTIDFGYEDAPGAFRLEPAGIFTG
jgi:hypothetical protein